MKRFQRKSTKITQQQRQQIKQRQKTEPEQLTSPRSESQLDSLTDIQSKSSVTIIKSSIRLLQNILNNKTTRNIKTAMQKIQEQSFRSEKFKSKITKLLALDSRKLDNFQKCLGRLAAFVKYRLKEDVFWRIRARNHMGQHKIRGIRLTGWTIFAINRRCKLVAFLRIMEQVKSNFKQDNKNLKQIQNKYNQISIPQQIITQSRKLLRISSKSPKPFMKFSQQTFQPCLQQLSNDLEQKRLKKSIPSDTQVLTLILKNYIALYKQLNTKLLNIQKDIKACAGEKAAMESQSLQKRRQNQKKTKEMNKFDKDLTQRWDIFDDQWSLDKLRTLNKVVNMQIKICQNKMNDGYQYMSRMVVLKTTSILLKKLLQQFQSLQKQKNKSPSPNQKNRSNIKSPSHKKANSIIKQQNSIQENDVLDRICQMIQRIIKRIQNSSVADMTGTDFFHQNDDQKADSNINDVKQVSVKIEQLVSQCCKKLTEQQKLHSVDIQSHKKQIQQKQSQIESLRKSIQLLSKQRKQSQSKMNEYQKLYGNISKKQDQNNNKLKLIDEQYKKFKQKIKLSKEKTLQKVKSMSRLSMDNIMKPVSQIGNSQTNRTVRRKFDEFSLKFKESHRKLSQFQSISVQNQEQNLYTQEFNKFINQQGSLPLLLTKIITRCRNLSANSQQQKQIQNLIQQICKFSKENSLEKLQNLAVSLIMQQKQENEDRNQFIQTRKGSAQISHISSINSIEPIKSIVQAQPMTTKKSKQVQKQPNTERVGIIDRQQKMIKTPRRLNFNNEGNSRKQSSRNSQLAKTVRISEMNTPTKY